MDNGPYGHTHDERHPMPLSRRRFLRTSAMAVAGGVLFSCTGGRRIPQVDDAIPSTDTRWPIKRVIYVMLENRSFNNLFGTYLHGPLLPKNAWLADHLIELAPASRYGGPVSLDPLDDRFESAAHLSAEKAARENR